MAAQIPNIDAARCSGCGRCIAACHLRLFAFEQQGRKKISVLHDRDRCSGCGECDAICVIGAITMDEKAASQHYIFRSPSVFHDDRRVRYFAHSGN